MERTPDLGIEFSFSCFPLNNHMNLDKHPNLSGPQVVYLGTVKNICPTYHLGLLMTMKLNTICKSHLWNVECYIKFVISVRADIISSLTMPDITQYLVTTCFCCFSNIPIAKSCSFGALWVQAGTLCESVEKWWLISEKRNVRNLWVAHLQLEFIVLLQLVRFSLKLWSLHVNMSEQKRRNSIPQIQH